MAYFPIFVDLKEKKCLIIGGGHVACRKVRMLASFGAQMLVVAEHASEEMLALAESMKDKTEEGSAVRLEIRPAKAEDAENMDYVFCASDDKELHSQVAAYCRENRIPINSADDKENCTFLFPGLVRQGDVVLGITTGGNSPVVSKYLRGLLEERLPDYLGSLAERLGNLRGTVKESVPDGRQREQIFNKLFWAGMERNGELPEDVVQRILEQGIEDIK